MDREMAALYLQENFEPRDRLAMVLIQKETHQVIQRIGTADRIAAEDFQAWLRHMNARQFEIYVSMNVLAENAHGRTKEDVALIRHIFLDFDYQGTERVQALLARQDTPTPNYLVNSSPGKWQVVWKVERFEPTQAEALQRSLAREMGADLAATDSSRVLRLPGFYNHKYAKPHLVRNEVRSVETYRPEHFRQMTLHGYKTIRERERRDQNSHLEKGLSQSERDWAYAKRALSRGTAPEEVVQAVMRHRLGAKSNVQGYAERTVRKAQSTLQPGIGNEESWTRE